MWKGVVAMVVAGLLTVEAAALEVLSAQELAEHCQAVPEELDSIDGTYCVRYVQGFVDGAIATDVRVMLNVEAEAERSSVTERAMRTRMIDRNQVRRAAGYAQFCLGDPVELLDVVASVVEDLRERVVADDADGTARDLVYDSLRRHYPCSNEAE